VSVDARPTAMTRVDIGGTWMRIDTGRGRSREASPSLINHPDRSPRHLFEMLVDRLVSVAPERGSVALSLGAAMDDVTGVVHGSGPLWGDWVPDRDLRVTLGKARPDVTWHLFNDVTCAVAALAHSVGREGHGRIGYLTISSGIGLKIAQLDSGRIEVDHRGLQGEVGHLPAVLPPGRAHLGELRCECGRAGHVAALASGPGIARVASALGISGYSPQWLRAGLDRGEEQPRRLLEYCAYPVAEVLRALWTTQPGLGVVGIGGGVAQGLGEHYRSALLGRLDGRNGYADDSSTQWQQRIRVLDEPGVDLLHGAQILAEGGLRVTRVGMADVRISGEAKGRG